MTENMATTTDNRIRADRRAFDAYNILYYPVFDPNANDVPTPIEQDWALAIAANENLDRTSYTLSDEAVATLAAIYAHLRSNDTDKVIDPSADIRDIVSDAAWGDPMYPDFPTQVLNMPEEQFRTDQILHYASTYGMEFFASLFGAEINVHRGWLPDTDETEKTRVDGDNVEKHVLSVIASKPAMVSLITRELARPTRMPESALSIAAELYETGDIDGTVKVAFHENMMGIVSDAADISSNALARACESLCQHPGDVLKAVLWRAEKTGKNHIKTKAKKGFCRALESFDAKSIAGNIADLSHKGERAVNMLSVGRFGRNALTEAVALVESGEVRSFNSRLESAWKLYDEVREAFGTSNAANLEGALRECEDSLLEIYAERPGVLLRSIARLVRNYVDREKVYSVAAEHVDDFSLATLIQVATASSATSFKAHKDWTGRAVNAADIERREGDERIRKEVAWIVARLVSERLSHMMTPLADKKVFVDPCGFSLGGSVILPNEVGNTSGAYPPAGMAYDVPADKTVRFFTFWDNRSERVDVDLHFHYTDVDGRSGHIGWNSAYKSDGMVTSGDITHSENAAEYLDIDMAEAKASGVDTVIQHDHIYCGAYDWHGIDKCFSGALVVGDTEPDVALYNSSNVLFHDDMTGEGRDMDYAMVDVQNHYVRILRGVSMPFVRTLFNLETYIGLLLDAQGASKVDCVEDADVVLSVGRAAHADIDGKPVVSLIDEKFFIE